MSYSRLIAGLKVAGVEVDRKILADLAVTDSAAFGALVDVARDALNEDGTVAAAAPAAERSDAEPVAAASPASGSAADKPAAASASTDD